VIDPLGLPSGSCMRSGFGNGRSAVGKVMGEMTLIFQVGKRRLGMGMQQPASGWVSRTPVPSNHTIRVCKMM